MSDVITFVQAVAWPLLTAGLCFWLRTDVPRVIRAVATRIEQGDQLEAGASGIKLLGAKQASPTAMQVASATSEAVPHLIYLLHTARRAPRLDKDEREYYRLRVWVDSDYPEALAQIQNVTYHLHPSFKEPNRTVSASESEFALATSAWGQFMLHATVKMKDGSSVNIERYINF
jgi:YEATS family